VRTGADENKKNERVVLPFLQVNSIVILRHIFLIKKELLRFLISDGV